MARWGWAPGWEIAGTAILVATVAFGISPFAFILSSARAQAGISPSLALSQSSPTVFTNEAVTFRATPQGFPTPKNTSQALVYSTLDCGGGTALSSDFEYLTALGDSTLQLPHPIPFHRGIFACVYATPGTYAMHVALSFIEGSYDSYTTRASASAEASVFVAPSPGTGTATAIPPGATQFDIPNPAQPNAPGAYTWTASSGVTKVHVWAWGGGGAGYKVYGGGGGGFGEADVPVTPGASYDVKVGGGGDPTYWMWSRGGDSSFGSFVTARGGNAGEMTAQNIHYSDQDTGTLSELFTPGTGGGASFGRGVAGSRGFQGEQGTRQDVACPGAEFSICHGPVGAGGQGGGKGGTGGTGANRNGGAPGGGGGFANAYFAGGGNPEGTGGYGGGGRVIIAPVTEVPKNTPPAGKPDLTATTPAVQWVGGPTTGKEAQNIFAAGATVRVSAYIQNQGTAGAGATQSGWRAAEAPLPEFVARFGDAPPLVETPALEAGRRALLMREIADIRAGSFGMGLCADEGNNAAESEEGNNCSPQPVRFTVLEARSIQTVTPTTPTPQAPPPAPPPATRTSDFCTDNPSLCYRWDGWIKLSGKATDGRDYGVRYDPKTTRFCGYAWGGSVVGWVEFGPLPASGGGCVVEKTSDGKHYLPSYWARLADTVPEPDREGTGSRLFMIVVPGFPDQTGREETLPPDIAYDSTRPTNPPNTTSRIPLPPPYQLTGWAWSSNIGWVSLSSDNVLHDEGARYHVTMEVKGDKDKTSGRSLKGYAWSPNIGWVKFDAEPFGEERRPGDPDEASTLNVNSNILEGWARACAATIHGDCNSAIGDYHGQ